MFTSTDTKKGIDNIQRALRKLGTERNFFNMIKEYL